MDAGETDAGSDSCALQDGCCGHKPAAHDMETGIQLCPSGRQQVLVAGLHIHVGFAVHLSHERDYQRITLRMLELLMWLLAVSSDMFGCVAGSLTAAGCCMHACSCRDL
jgi:hypothetical protein